MHSLCPQRACSLEGKPEYSGKDRVFLGLERPGDPPSSIALLPTAVAQKLQLIFQNSLPLRHPSQVPYTLSGPCLCLSEPVHSPLPEHSLRVVSPPGSSLSSPQMNRSASSLPSQRAATGTCSAGERRDGSVKGRRTQREGAPSPWHPVPVSVAVCEPLRLPKL